ncbi:hypothetical protein GCM10020000_87200 [Streptomyces olivoverticillatus]
MNTSHSHHPHFLSMEEAHTPQGTRRVFHFQEFTGLEPEPALVAYSPHMALEEWAVLEEELRAARVMWNIARFRRALRPQIASAAPCWERYRQASRTMNTRFAVMEDTQDPDWCRHTLKLVKAQDAALEAAAAFDTAAAAIARLVEDFEQKAGEGSLPPWRSFADELGIVADTWEVLPVAAYDDGYEQSGHPLYDRIAQEAGQQREQLKTVADLTGSR